MARYLARSPIYAALVQVIASHHQPTTGETTTSAKARSEHHQIQWMAVEEEVGRNHTLMTAIE